MFLERAHARALAEYSVSRPSRHAFSPTRACIFLQDSFFLFVALLPYAPFERNDKEINNIRTTRNCVSPAWYLQVNIKYAVTAYLFYCERCILAFKLVMSQNTRRSSHPFIFTSTNAIEDRDQHAEEYPNMFVSQRPPYRAASTATTDQYHRTESIWRIIIDVISLIIRKTFHERNDVRAMCLFFQ